MGNPHDAPTAQQLLAAVREWLENDVMPAVSGRLQFHSRVASNILAMVERELADPAADAAAHAERLGLLGAADDAALAALVRAGRFDGELAHVLDVLEPSVRRKVEVANPRWLED